MNLQDLDALAKGLAPVVAKLVDAATMPLIARIAALEAVTPEPGAKGDPGERGADGVDGKDAEPVSDAQIAAAVEAYLIANPPQNGKDGADGIDGKDGAPGKDGEPGRDGIDGKDGLDGADGKDGRDGIDGEKGDPGRDGVGLADALIDRDNNLVVTLTDGSTKSLGLVVGRDGRDGIDGKDGAPGERGERGFSLDQFAPELKADGRTLVLKFVSGETAESWEIGFPAAIYRGVYKDGQTYDRGDLVTWAGSLWHCDAETAQKPGDGAEAWTLAAKRGRDGKDGAPGKPGERGAKGEPGRDGRTWG